MKNVKCPICHQRMKSFRTHTRFIIRTQSCYCAKCQLKGKFDYKKDIVYYYKIKGKVLEYIPDINKSMFLYRDNLIYVNGLVDELIIKELLIRLNKLEIFT